MGDGARAPFEAERCHRDLPAAIDLADHIGQGNAHIVIEALGEVSEAGHCLYRPHFDLRAAHVAYHPTDTLVARLVRIGADQQFLPDCVLRVGRPDLGAVDHKVVAIDRGLAFQAGQIGPRAGFGEALTPVFLAAQDRRQVPLLLRLAARNDQRRPGMAQCHEHRGRGRRAGAGIFLMPDQLFQNRRPASAIFLRPGYSCPACIKLAALPGKVKVAQGCAFERPQTPGNIVSQPVAALRAKLVEFGRRDQMHYLCLPPANRRLSMKVTLLRRSHRKGRTDCHCSKKFRQCPLP